MRPWPGKYSLWTTARPTGTAEVLPREFPGIKLIRSEKNLGFARAVNLAAQPATGEFLLLLNSDARPEAGALALAVQWQRANPRCAVAGAQLLNADGSRQNSIANFPTLATELLNKSLLPRLRPKAFPGKEQTFPAPVAVETVVGAFMLIRKSAWDMLGGLDERFFFFFEETDFCLRVRQKNLSVMHLPQVRVWHGQGQTARQVSVDAPHRILALPLRLFHQKFWRRRPAHAAGRAFGKIAGGLAGGGVAGRVDAGNKSALALTAERLFRAGRLASARLPGECGAAR